MLVIFNPAAGTRRRRRFERVAGALAEAGIGFTVADTTAPGDAETLARAAVAVGERVVVAAGGDGTIAEVANGIAGSDARLDELIAAPGSGSAASDRLGDLRSTQREARTIAREVILKEPAMNQLTRAVDRVVLHPVAGLLILIAILFLMFQAVFTWAVAPMDVIEAGIGMFGASVGNTLGEGWFKSLVVDGVIATVHAPDDRVHFIKYFICRLRDFFNFNRRVFLHLIPRYFAHQPDSGHSRPKLIVHIGRNAVPFLLLRRHYCHLFFKFFSFVLEL